MEYCGPITLLAYPKYCRLAVSCQTSGYRDENGSLALFDIALSSCTCCDDTLTPLHDGSQSLQWSHLIVVSADFLLVPSLVNTTLLICGFSFAVVLENIHSFVPRASMSWGALMYEFIDVCIPSLTCTHSCHAQPCTGGYLYEFMNMCPSSPAYTRSFHEQA